MGSIFIINGGVYALTAPLWGFLCDKISRPQYVTLFGSIFIFISFLIIGPVSFIPVETLEIKQALFYTFVTRSF